MYTTNNIRFDFSVGVPWILVVEGASTIMGAFTIAGDGSLRPANVAKFRACLAEEGIDEDGMWAVVDAQVGPEVVGQWLAECAPLAVAA